MKNYLLVACLFVAQSLTAQVQNGFDFDGVDDYLGQPNGSASLAGLSAFSMACWVQPTNASPAFPNFDGIIGYRNESNADFFILQLSAVNFEARLRNSNGQAFTITSPTCQLNQWQHIALIYTGSQLRFYHNGVLSQSISASGTINNPNVEFNIGRIPFQTTPFWLQGKVDEVGIWSRALSDTEVLCLARQKLDSSMAGLVHYFPMDEGVAGGNNGILPYVTDIKSNNHAFFYGAALTGATSNFVTGTQQITQIADSACQGSQYSLHGRQFLVPGVYDYRIAATEGCDSAIHLQLTARQLNVGVSQNRELLTATNTQASAFQWLRCDQNFAPIAGANSASYQALANGQYAVAITEQGCTDTSACFTVSTVSVETEVSSSFRLFPNPATEQLFIDWPSHIQVKSLRCFHISGTEVPINNQSEPNQTWRLDVATLPPGFYLIEVQTAHQWHFLKWQKGP